MPANTALNFLKKRNSKILHNNNNKNKDKHSYLILPEPSRSWTSGGVNCQSYRPPPMLVLPHQNNTSSSFSSSFSITAQFQLAPQCSNFHYLRWIVCLFDRDYCGLWIAAILLPPLRYAVTTLRIKNGPLTLSFPSQQGSVVAWSIMKGISSDSCEYNALSHLL